MALSITNGIISYFLGYVKFFPVNPKFIVKTGLTNGFFCDILYNVKLL